MKKHILITDVDNTLFDWFGMWHASFSALFDKVLEISCIPRETLIGEMRSIFQKYGTSEYAFVLEECPSLKKMYQDPRKSLDEAVVAYKDARAKSLHLYDGVYSTLTRLHQRNIKVIAYTESLQYYTAYRLESLGIARLIDVLYSPPDHEIAMQRDRSINETAPELVKRLTPPGEFKPNPAILKQIIDDARATAGDCIYVGDSEMKDIAMANQAGVQSVLARYGSSHFEERADDYNLLRSVSHWSEADVERERRLKAAQSDISPDFTIDSFSEIISFFE